MRRAAVAGLVLIGLGGCAGDDPGPLIAGLDQSVAWCAPLAELGDVIGYSLLLTSPGDPGVGAVVEAVDVSVEGEPRGDLTIRSFVVTPRAGDDAPPLSGDWASMDDLVADLSATPLPAEIPVDRTASVMVAIDVADLRSSADLRDFVIRYELEGRDHVAPLEGDVARTVLIDPTEDRCGLDFAPGDGEDS